MNRKQVLSIRNGQAFPVSDRPLLPVDHFRRWVVEAVADANRLAALWASETDGRHILTAVVAADAQGLLHVVTTAIEREFPSLTPDCPQAERFEREIHEQWGLIPVGHPWLKPVRVLPQAADFYAMAGDEIHEVAVGPVHAGIIEPGHFRFQCHGETVYHLEIALGYQHRGVERAMVGGPHLRSIHYMETLAGDTSIGHALAHCQAIEAISQMPVPARAQVLRGVALELERVANHVGDLGALAGDIGFLPTMSYCGRIRGDVLNLTATLCGNRFGRGLVRPGGVGFDVDLPTVNEMKRRVGIVLKDTQSAVELLWNSPSVMARFDQTGALTRPVCDEIGLVGVAARACGAARDVRSDHPFGIYRFAQIPVSTWHTGDVFARAYVRWLEIQRSLAFIDEQLDSLPDGPVLASSGSIRPDYSVVSLVEGWRGEICHAATTDSRARFQYYKVVDPSFHNWFGLAVALRNQQISDFPLCNKSFNLSYCGHDL